MINLSINIAPGLFHHIENMPLTLKRKARNAINKKLTFFRRRINEKIREKYRISQTNVNKQIKVTDRAHVNKLTGKIKIFFKPRKITKYSKGRRINRPEGTLIEIKKGDSKIVKGTFYAKGRGGSKLIFRRKTRGNIRRERHVIISGPRAGRTTSKQLPIEPVYSIGVGAMANQVEILGNVGDLTSREFEDELIELINQNI